MLTSNNRHIYHNLAYAILTKAESRHLPCYCHRQLRPHIRPWSLWSMGAL